MVICFEFRREKRDIPFIIESCVTEVEKRGTLEVGIYRVSGSASDLARLKKAFETSKFFLIVSRSNLNFTKNLTPPPLICSQTITKPKRYWKMWTFIPWLVFSKHSSVNCRKRYSPTCCIADSLKYSTSIATSMRMSWAMNCSRFSMMFQPIINSPLISFWTIYWSELILIRSLCFRTKILNRILYFKTGFISMRTRTKCRCIIWRWCSGRPYCERL